MKKLFKTPVVIFIFNRPDLTRVLFEKIAQLKPLHLYIVSDGPRDDIYGEVGLVEECRRIFRKINWDCQVSCNYSNVNLGCKKRISSGVSWVFSHEKTAIFLEDDCYPDDTFFSYCEELLEKYMNNPKINIINGANHIGNMSSNFEADYYLSKYAHIWGWASWSHKWVKNYDVDMREWPRYRKIELLKSIFKSNSEVRFWTNYFDQVYEKKIDTWDFQVSYMNFTKGLLAIAPAKNLISNIGFNRDDATHTKSNSSYAGLRTYAASVPLRHPSVLEEHAIYDAEESKQYRYHAFQVFIRRLYYKLKRKITK